MVEVVAERGAPNVTVAHVVARSGVSRRTFYELFDDRDACLLAALEDAIEWIAAVVVPAYEQSQTWPQRMKAGLVALLRVLDNEPAIGRLVIVESLGAGPDAVEYRKRVLGHVIAAVDGGRLETKNGDSLSSVTAEGVIGGVLSVLYSRLSSGDSRSLVELAGPLMSMIVLPYLGAAAAKRELQRPAPERDQRRAQSPANPLRDLDMRLTYRTVRTLMSVAAHPGSSNREVGLAADIHDQGQISKLLTRLHKLGLIENGEAGQARGAPNAWLLTAKGAEVERAIALRAG